MNFIIDTFFRKRKKDEKNSDQGELNSATAKGVLKFLSHGLTHGVVSLAAHYQPSSKVQEFVAVSGQTLSALKQHNDEKLSSDSVHLTLHINGNLKQIDLNQMGRDVMLSLNGSTVVIRHTSLTLLYAQLRNDMLRHGEIYGAELQAMAASFSSPD